MSSTSDAYECILQLAGAAVQSYSAKHFSESSRLISTKGKTVLEVLDNLSDASRELCLLEYFQIVQLCLRVCHHNSSHREDEVTVRLIMYLVNKAREKIQGISTSQDN